MLVLSRLRDETIMIGDDIEITVVDIRGDKVRLGITAPTRIAVHRKEVYDAIRAENQRAAQIHQTDLAALSPTGTDPALTAKVPLHGVLRAGGLATGGAGSGSLRPRTGAGPSPLPPGSPPRLAREDRQS